MAGARGAGPRRFEIAWRAQGHRRHTPGRPGFASAARMRCSRSAGIGGRPRRLPSLFALLSPSRTRSTREFANYLLTRSEILFGQGRYNPQSGVRETPMDVPTPSVAADESIPSESQLAAALSKLRNQITPQSALHQSDADRIRSSLARLTSSSVEGLEGLTAELQELQTFLRVEAKSVQGKIESALAGINIIMETIAPWRNA